MLNTERLCLGCMTDNGGERVCPICGYDAATKNPENSLPAKFVLKNRYLVGKETSSNGEGISYIGWDNANDAIVTIREYFPTGFALRNPDKTVAMVKGNEYTFNEGLLEFKDIKCNIMASELASLVPVIDVFEENGTVYSVEANIQGITLSKFLDKNGGILKWEQARALFLPLIDTIKGMNDIGIIHGGISAETIIVGRDGKLRITDYAIKKTRQSDSELVSELFNGYAAIEQYGFEGMHTDTYTDVYGICATLFRVLIGTVPPESAKRIQNDSMSIPAKFAEELPRHVLAALANGLQVLPEERTRNIEAFKNELVYGEIPNATVVKHTQKAASVAEKEKPAKKGGSAISALIAAGITVGVFIIIGLILIFGPLKDVVFPPKEPAYTSEEAEVNAPEVDKIGDVDSGAELTSKLYTVPDLKGKLYAEVIDNEEYEMFEFAISSKSFSDQYPKGTICSQSIAPGGDGVVRDTKIEVVISLGPKEIKIANLKGLTKDEAILELLKQGFIYDNIEILEKYDEDLTPGVAIDQSPKYGDKVSTDVGVKIYINSYTGDETESNSSNNRRN